MFRLVYSDLLPSNPQLLPKSKHARQHFFQLRAEISINPVVCEFEPFSKPVCGLHELRVGSTKKSVLGLGDAGLRAQAKT